MSTYARPPHTDFEDARAFEDQVAEALRPHVHTVLTQFTSNDKVDIMIPPLWLDIKEKKQSYTERWMKHWPNMAEPDAFIIDELSVRRLVEHHPYGYVLVQDRPLGRLLTASTSKLITMPKVQLDRQTSPDRKKGKWLVDLQHFRPLDRIEDVLRVAEEDAVQQPWKQSPALSQFEVPTV